MGKSALFYALTGKYATISNYPGTTVDVAIARMRDIEVIDTPGMHSLVPVTGEEEVARRLLEEVDLVVHVVDAKNIKRALPFTLQLIEAGFNVILVLNLVDEAEKLGIFINEKMLEQRLGIPVIKTIATEKRGVGSLKEEIRRRIDGGKDGRQVISSAPRLRRLSRKLKRCLKETTAFQKGHGILLLLKDPISLEMVKKERNYDKIVERVNVSGVLPYEIMREIYEDAEEMLNGVMRYEETSKGLTKKIGVLFLNPLFGIPLSILSLAFIYLLAGYIGAQILVDFIETWFEENINSAVNAFLYQNVPNYWDQGVDRRRLRDYNAEHQIRDSNNLPDSDDLLPRFFDSGGFKITTENRLSARWSLQENRNEW